MMPNQIRFISKSKDHFLVEGAVPSKGWLFVGCLLERCLILECLNVGCLIAKVPFCRVAFLWHGRKKKGKKKRNNDGNSGTKIRSQLQNGNWLQCRHLCQKIMNMAHDHYVVAICYPKVSSLDVCLLHNNLGCVLAAEFIKSITPYLCWQRNQIHVSILQSSGHKLYHTIHLLASLL